jgi:hypothetical protein
MLRAQVDWSFDLVIAAAEVDPEPVGVLGEGDLQVDGLVQVDAVVVDPALGG